MGLLDLLKRNKAPEIQPIETGGKLVKEDFTVVGIHYHPDSIKRIAIANPDWRKGAKTLVAEGKAGQPVLHYTYPTKPVQILPDEKGIYDKKALMVLLAGEHVGYISREDQEHVKRILAGNSIKYITAKAEGGEYKVISAKGDVVKTEAPVRISVRIAYS